MMRRITAAMAIIGLLGLGACGSDTTSQGTTATTADREATTTAGADEPATTTTRPVSRTLTKADAGTTVALKTGDRFEVSLEWCPGCGYHWQPQSTAGGVLTLEGSRDEQPQNPAGSPPTVGGTGRQVFTYSVVGAGTAKVEIGSIPPGHDAPEETWSVTVTAT
jgi:predicted secreted protein